MGDVDLESLPGVGPATAEKLKDAGFDTYQSLAVASPSELSNTADVGESTAADIVQAARKTADIGGFESGAAVLERREQIGKLEWPAVGQRPAPTRAGWAGWQRHLHRLRGHLPTRAYRRHGSRAARGGH